MSSSAKHWKIFLWRNIQPNHKNQFKHRTHQKKTKHKAFYFSIEILLLMVLPSNMMIKFPWPLFERSVFLLLAHSQAHHDHHSDKTKKNLNTRIIKIECYQGSLPNITFFYMFWNPPTIFDHLSMKFVYGIDEILYLILGSWNGSNSNHGIHRQNLLEISFIKNIVYEIRDVNRRWGVRRTDYDTTESTNFFKTCGKAYLL